MVEGGGGAKEEEAVEDVMGFCACGGGKVGGKRCGEMEGTFLCRMGSSKVEEDGIHTEGVVTPLTMRDCRGGGGCRV